MKPETAGWIANFGIAARYPGEDADRAAAEASVRIAANVRAVLREKLGYP